MFTLHQLTLFSLMIKAPILFYNFCIIKLLPNFHMHLKSETRYKKTIDNNFMTAVIKLTRFLLQTYFTPLELVHTFYAHNNL